MIHYHGTPAGGTRQDAARFLAGRHALVPFPRQDDMGVVAEVCQSFVFDNGAFSVWKKGSKLDVEGYARWVEDWHKHPGFDWALIPDVIDGDEAANGGSISRFGMYAPPTAGQRANVIADRIEAHNSSPIWQRETQVEMAL